MKIAILTQPLGHNYGGMMQAWALQQVLKKLGHDPITIDRYFENPSFARALANFAHKSLLKMKGKYKGPMFSKRIQHSITANPRRFVNDNINISSRITTTNQLRSFVQRGEFEAIIVGSDQVWRREYSPDIYNYFLDFAEDLDLRRISYAASFGGDNWGFTEEQTKAFSRLINKFDMVSVREISAIELCRKWLATESVLALDPTLLLDEIDYVKLINNECISGKPYVFTYFLDSNCKKSEISKLISSELSLPIFNLGATGSLDGYRCSNAENYLMPEVGQWLSGFKNASFVVTDSFHGMVFSIIYRKPFLVIKNDERGSSRFDSLLAILGISNRAINAFSVDLGSKIYDQIEADVYTKLQALKVDSIFILKNSLM